MKYLTEASLPTEWGRFRMITFGEDKDQYTPHVALVHELCDKHAPVLLRIHSECLTGDVFGSQRCDCGEQLHKSMEWIGKEKGTLIYLRQEGRGIGISHKLDAYQLQDKGLNTIDANVHLGFEPDERDYESAVAILKYLGITQVRLLTNNPDKIDALQKSDIKVIERRALVSSENAENKAYLDTKRVNMGHLFNS